MTRHPINPNLTIHNEDNYLGFPIQVDKGPFILEYLQGLHVTMTRAIGQYSRVFAFRFDLHFPSSMSLYNVANDNAVIDRFIESFKAKIRHDRYMASRVNKSAHDTVVRYVWTREAGGRLGRPHYHFAIFLNYDAYCAIGTFELGRENMFNRILEAWAGSLGLQAQDALGD